MIAVGVARPMAHGQAMIRTATAERSATAMSPVTTSHPASVSRAMPRTIGTNTELTRSARRWTGAFEAWASSTSLTIWARAVSAPSLVTSTSIRPCWLMVAPNTRSPGALSTGCDSPVSMDSSIEVAPAPMVPSVGIFSPGSTTTTSPRRRSSTGIMISNPSRETLASLAPSSSSLVMALDALPFALASK